MEENHMFNVHHNNLDKHVTVRQDTLKQKLIVFTYIFTCRLLQTLNLVITSNKYLE